MKGHKSIRKVWIYEISTNIITNWWIK
jgi:hypothetical protein